MWNGLEEEHFLRVLDRYHELHPNVVLDHLGSVRDDTKTLRAIVAGNPPDLATLADTLYLGPLAANEALTPMDDLFREAGFHDETFVPGALEPGRFQGRLMAMPFLIDNQALLWNREIFRKAGLNPDQPPRTLEDLIAVAKKLTVRDAAGKITQLGFMPTEDCYLFHTLTGGKLVDESGRITSDSPEMVAGLEAYKQLMDGMGTFEEVNAYKSGFGAAQSANNPFFVGKVAMMINGEWNTWWIQKFAPQLDYGITPVPPPAAHPERLGTTWIGGNLFIIPKGCKHPKEAWDLLVWLQTDEAQILLAAANNNIPNQKSAIMKPELRTGSPYRVKFGSYLDLAMQGKYALFPPIPVAGLYNGEMLSARDLAWSGSKSAKQALEDVRRRVQRELDRYKPASNLPRAAH